jgi:hypothetical protein
MSALAQRSLRKVGERPSTTFGIRPTWMHVRMAAKREASAKLEGGLITQPPSDEGEICKTRN